ncbi:MAG: hypothetical protein DHS20C15_25370 [Planctomycetota bacterium]|nr:MAG: hypothetical protein DHS20C15_25370 [Planctomycetota bacterium]
MREGQRSKPTDANRALGGSLPGCDHALRFKALELFGEAERPWLHDEAPCHVGRLESTSTRDNGRSAEAMQR